MLRTLAVLATAITAQSSVLLHAADCAALEHLTLQRRHHYSGGADNFGHAGSARRRTP